MMRTTCKPGTFGPGVYAYDGYLHLPGNTRPWEEYLRDDNHFLAVDAWWSQVIFIVDRKQVTRRQLALWASEKAGGAHADSKLDPSYEALLRMWTSMPVGSVQGEPTVVPHQHLFALRRFALEVLASKEMLDVAWPNGQRPVSRVIADWPDSWSPIMNRVHDIASVYFTNLPKVGKDRDGEAVGRVLQLIDEIRLPLSEWHADHFTWSSQYAAALQAYAQIQALSPGHLHSLYALGYVNHQLGQHAEAERYLIAAITAAPEHVPSLYALANLYLEQDHFDKAHAYYEMVLDRDPNHAAAKTNMEILALSERALVPEQAIQALIELGNRYLSLGMSAGAKSTFERVLQIDPDHGVAAAALQTISAGSD